MTTEDRIEDWATDYDIFDPSYISEPYPVWQKLRDACPIAHSDRWGASWMPTKYADLFAIAQDFGRFSSRDIGVGSPGGSVAEPTPESDPFYGVQAPPITSDPPEHTWSRKLLLPFFSLKATAKYEEKTRAHCNRLIDGFIDNGRADAAADYAQQIPSYVIAEMLGVPSDMTPTFTQWVRDILEFGLINPEQAAIARNEGLSYLWGAIQERKAALRDDLISDLLRAEVDGAPVPDQHVLGTCGLLLDAGIDTTWSSIGSALWHLAQHPEDRKRIIDEPDIIQAAVEELLRAYSPVTMARVVTEDYEYDGCPMKANDKMLMSFPAANRDPEKFEAPDSVIIDRAKNPHIAFGVGIHRCVGSNLARMEMRVSIEEWLRRIPDFHLEDPAAVAWAGGQVRGPRELAVAF